MKTHASLGISCLMHCLLCSAFLSLHFIQSGNPSLLTQSISSYSYTLPAFTEKNTVSHKNSVAQLVEQPTKSDISTHKKENKLASAHHFSEKSESASAANKAEDNEALLKILHQAIFQKQVYPESALLMHQTGSAKIGMQVNPDGMISHVILLKSSGVTSIDNAALNAVQSVSPIKQVIAYLKEPHAFSITVSFI